METLKAAAATVGEKASTAAVSAATVVADKTSTAASTVGTRIAQTETGQLVAGKVDAKRKEFGEAWESKKKDFKELIEKWLKLQIHDKVERLVNTFPGIAKNLIEDPDMPRVVSRGKDRAIDVLWPDVKEEIMWETAVLIDGQNSKSLEEELENSPPACCLLAFLRYHIYPYDKSIWGCMRDPVWWVFTLGCLIPVSGFYSFVFALLFLLIDRRDEYQLVFYILSFKGFQFFTHGIVRTCMGFWLYVACAAGPRDANSHNCAARGPGTSGFYPLIIGGWLLQIIMVLLAWAILPFADEKGRTKLKDTLKDEVEHEDNANTASGGYLRKFMIYDCICFLCCFVALCVVTFLGSRNDEGLGENEWKYNDWVRKQAAFCIQVIYGYLSFPFFIFNIPILTNVLTHAVPTAYDSQGRTRKFVGPPQPPKTTMYLPKQLKGGGFPNAKVDVLVKVGKDDAKLCEAIDSKKLSDDWWRVDFSKMKTPPQELAFRRTKHLHNTAACTGLEDGEFYEGEDEGQWVKCYVPNRAMAMMTEAVAEELLNKIKTIITGGNLDLTSDNVFSVLQSGLQRGKDAARDKLGSVKDNIAKIGSPRIGNTANDKEDASAAEAAESGEAGPYVPKAKPTTAADPQAIGAGEL